MAGGFRDLMTLVYGWWSAAEDNVVAGPYRTPIGHIHCTGGTVGHQHSTGGTIGHSHTTGGTVGHISG